MKPERFAAVALGALFTLSACAENPVGPTSSDIHSPGAASAFRGAASYTFSRLDVPGASATIPSGINADGQVVGWYMQAGVTKGFIYDHGTWTTNIVYPGATVTQIRGIGPDGTVVGSYRNASEPTNVPAHAFVRTTDGVFTAVNFPGHVNDIAQRILPNGTLLGCYHDANSTDTMHGAAFSRDTYAAIPSGDGYSSLDNPTTMTDGGTPGGNRLTGQVMDMSVTPSLQRAFVVDDGIFAAFDAPGSTSTIAWDMNPAGTVVGLFVHAGSTHGFMLDHWSIVDGAVSGTFNTVDFPMSSSTNAAYTDIFGINAARDIVGKFRETASGPFHGYIATRKGEE